MYDNIVEVNIFKIKTSTKSAIPGLYIKNVENET